jgi:hypothetical protein
MLYILKPSKDIFTSDIAALSEVFGIEPAELMTRAQNRLRKEGD